MINIIFIFIFLLKLNLKGYTTKSEFIFFFFNTYNMFNSIKKNNLSKI